MKKETIHTGGNHWRKSLAVTLILILVMIIMSIFIVHRINHMEEDYSFERLYEEAAALSQDMQIYAKNDGEQLEILSTLVSGYDDPASPELWRLLGSYDSIRHGHPISPCCFLTIPSLQEADSGSMQKGKFPSKKNLLSELTYQTGKRPSPMKRNMSSATMYVGHQEWGRRQPCCTGVIEN